MGVTKQRIRVIVTHECQQMDISPEITEQACEHAMDLYEKINSFTTSIHSGIAFAVSLQGRHQGSQKSAQ